jgi:transforming growth factor-beta-induced protein
MKRTILLTMFMVLALILAACGGADPTPTPAPEPTEAPTEESMEEPTEEPMEEPAEEPMEEEMASNSIVDIAVADGRFTTLVAAVEAAGLAETLSGEGPFTVFAPTDEAFAALPEGTVASLLEDPAGDLTDILLYHVVEGAVMAADVVELESASTLLGEDISIEVEDNGVFLNGDVEVIITDIEADNGIIHVIDAVLLPPSEEETMEEMGSIVDIAVADGNFTTLVAAVEAAGLAETLSGEGEFTVFAPTDDAFAALPEGIVESLLEDPAGALTDILLYHVLDGVVPASEVVNLESATTLLGEDITIEVIGEDVVLNGEVEVIVTDIEASNGIIHVIDAVLLPPEDLPSIAEIAVEDGRFTTLVAALEAAGLVETLSGEGEFTVFAPTDEAFAALPEGVLDTLLADPEGDLTNILLYHVIEGVFLAEDVVTLESAPTLLGEDITITVTDDGVILNDTVMIIITDIEASNGVIHVIDAVLIPPSAS